MPPTEDVWITSRTTQIDFLVIQICGDMSSSLKVMSKVNYSLYLAVSNFKYSGNQDLYALILSRA